MNDNSQGHFLSARARKRSHREMSESTERNTTPAWSNHGEGSSSTAAARQPQPLTLPPYPPMRFPGDGYDFRRPVMASHSPQTEEIIDLTNEPDSPPRAQPSRYHSSSHRPRHHRPPRFGRNIMTDVVDLEEESDPSHNEAPEATRESPEVQFVRATVRSPGPMPRTFRANFLDYLRFRPQTMSTGTSTQHAETFRQGVAMRAREFSRRPTWRGLPGIDAFWIAEDQGELDLPLDLDMQMNYQLAGLMVENPPPGPSYKPPTPPPEGFTRTVQEDEEVICPNCERELGTGDDERQQIWISKQCGHVFCGECAKNRAVTKNKKLAQSAPVKTRPFKNCPVPGCGKQISAPKAMFQIYL